MGHSDFNIRIDLPSTHRFLNVAGLGIDAILQRLDDLIPGAEQVSREVQVAAQEICANIVDHAYADGENGRVTIEVSIGLKESRLDIHIRDTGKEFDENIVREPALGELQERGFGLYFAKQLMDQVNYRRHDNENHWHLIKHLKVSELDINQQVDSEHVLTS